MGPTGFITKPLPAMALYSFYCKSQKSRIKIQSKVYYDAVFNTSSVTTTYCHWFVHFRQVGPMDTGLGMEGGTDGHRTRDGKWDRCTQD